jgi:hypothetical protein
MKEGRFMGIAIGERGYLIQKPDGHFANVRNAKFEEPSSEESDNESEGDENEGIRLSWKKTLKQDQDKIRSEDDEDTLYEDAVEWRDEQKDNDDKDEENVGNQNESKKDEPILRRSTRKKTQHLKYEHQFHQAVGLLAVKKIEVKR